MPIYTMDRSFIPHSASGIKRGSDELLGIGHPQMAANGSSPPMVHLLENQMNEAKKVKLTDGNEVGIPSKVIHIRSIPTEVSETEVISLGLPFGKVTNVLLMKKKNQAFIELEGESHAQAMVRYYNEVSPMIRGRPCFVQYSTHKELKTTQVNPAAQAALQAADGASAPHNTEIPKTVLRVIVENMLYPVTVDVMHKIFSKYGTVQKIITFTKNNTFQALIQMADPIAAYSAKFSLDGQNVYTACCTLKIDFSRLDALNVKYNNDKSRDFTNPNLPGGETITGGLPGAGIQPDPQHMALNLAGIPPGLMAATSAQFQMPPGGIPGFGSLAQYSFPQAAAPHMAGGMQMLSPQPATMAQLQAAHAGQQFPFPGMSPHPAAMGLQGFHMAGGLQTGSVVLVSNLNEEMVTPEALFTLFGVYGDVVRVKILFNKKDNALVQFAEPRQAALAMSHLDKVKVWGKQIRVAASKHPVVQMPKDSQSEGGNLTKDFTNSPLHRFKKKGSKNYQNIYAPSGTLHLSNIPPTASEEDLKEAFAQTGGEVKHFKFFPKDRKMALIEMGSIEESVTALIEMHNYQLGDSSHLRVSFSKSTI